MGPGKTTNPPAPGSSTTQIQPRGISSRDIMSRSLPQARTWLLLVSYVSRTCLVRGGSGDTLEIAGFLRFSPPAPRAPTRSDNSTLPRRPPARCLRHCGDNNPRPVVGQVKAPGSVNKDVLTPVPPVHDVVDRARIFQSKLTRHGSRFGRIAPARQGPKQGLFYGLAPSRGDVKAPGRDVEKVCSDPDSTS